MFPEHNSTVNKLRSSSIQGKRRALNKSYEFPLDYDRVDKNWVGEKDDGELAKNVRLNLTISNWKI